MIYEEKVFPLPDEDPVKIIFRNKLVSEGWFIVSQTQDHVTVRREVKETVNESANKKTTLLD